MNPGKKNSNLLKNTGIHFLEFALGFLSLAKCHYQPNKVEAVAAIKAMVTVLINAFISEWCVPVVNSDEYSFVENPVQLPNTFASVKE